MDTMGSCLVSQPVSHKESPPSQQPPPPRQQPAQGDDPAREDSQPPHPPKATPEQKGGRESLEGTQEERQQEGKMVVVSTSNSTDEQDAPAEEGEAFVNKGLQRWEHERSIFLSPPPVDPDHQPPPRCAIDIDVDEIIDLIFSNKWRNSSRLSVVSADGSTVTSKEGDQSEVDDGSFPYPVPLTQMVDILVDLWEAEGLEM